MRYHTSLAVTAEPATAFDYLADATNGLTSHPEGTTLERIPSGAIGIGTQYVFTRPDATLRSTIVEYDRPTRLQFENAFDGQPPTRSSWTLSPVEGGTRLMLETSSSFVGPRWVRPIAGLLTVAAWPFLMIKMWRLKRSIVRALEARRST